MRKVLVVEDEKSIRKLIKYDLEGAGYEVDEAEDGKQAIDKAMAENYDAIVLDVMLPKVDGFKVCEAIRLKNQKVFIIMLTAMGDELNKLTGFEAGVDDYLPKPFSTRELLARIKAGIRRTSNFKQEPSDNNITIGELVINKNQYTVTYQKQELHLTLKEYELLVHLLDNRDRTLSREIILDQVWGFEYDNTTRVLDIHMHNLRAKLKGTNVKISTVRGIGYMLAII